MPRWQRTTAWTLQIAAGIIFFNVGVSKLIGAERMVEIFSNLGSAQQLRHLVGFLEVVSAILLLLPDKVFIGSVLLIALIVSAIVAHLVLVGDSLIPAFVLLCIVFAIAWIRRPSEEDA